MNVATGLFYLSGGFALLVVLAQLAAITGLTSERVGAWLGYYFCVPMFVYFTAGCFAGLAS